MAYKRLLGGAALLALAAVLPAAGAAEVEDGLEARVNRLERLLENQTLVEMVTRLDRLQQEVQQLRGEVEVQSHTLEQLRQRQRDLYLDVDRRLSQVEREAQSGGVERQPTVAVPESTAGEGETTVQAGTSPEPEGRGEREAYQAAFDLLRELRYKEAIAAFRDFLQQYPDGRYAHIAQYWMGEANYARREFSEAVAAYRTLIERYPESPKQAEALLKIGYSQAELGKKGAARQVLERLIEQFPETTEAGQARNFLKSLHRDG